MVSAAHEPHDHTNHGAIRVSNALAPDDLRVAFGAPHEQAFIEEVTPGLFNIGVITINLAAAALPCPQAGEAVHRAAQADRSAVYSGLICTLRNLTTPEPY